MGAGNGTHARSRQCSPPRVADEVLIPPVSVPSTVDRNRGGDGHVPGTTHVRGGRARALERAQADVDFHIAVGPDGRCLVCSQEFPCPALTEASATLAAYGRLPARRPGLASRGLRGDAAFGASTTGPGGAAP